MVLKYVITGHSSETSETFEIPYNISIIFYADEGKTCYVPNDEESLKFVVNSMNEYKIYKAKDTIHNYNIEFINNYEGIALINDNGTFTFNNVESGKTLKDYCRMIQRQNNRQECIIYCVFCRGSEREFNDEDFGEFDNFDDFTDFDSDLHFGGKNKRKTRQNKNKENKTRKNKRNRRKNKRKPRQNKNTKRVSKK